MKHIFTNASLIHADGHIEINKNLEISDGIIQSISDSCESFDKNGALMTDSHGKFISPGLVNLHSHSPMSIFRGIAEDVTPDDWFNTEIWPYESKIERSDVAAGAKLAISEMIDNGVTAYADHYFEAECICEAAVETGIRLDMAPTLFGMTGGFDEQLASFEKFFLKWKEKSPYVSIRLGPHAPYTCDPDQLKQCADMAGKLGCGLHIHLEDEEAQINASLKQYGKTPAALLKDAGFMEHNLILGHAYWILPEERALLGEKTYIASCMKTYMKLGSGPGRIWQNSEELPLCIGTEGAASSNTLNPLEQARLFALTGKYMTGDAEKFDVTDIWKILMNGHNALSFNSGQLKEGFAADLVVWDLKQPHTMPVYNPLASIIYSADARNISDVMISGRFVKQNYKSLMDVQDIVEEADKRARIILEKGKGETKLKF